MKIFLFFLFLIYINPSFAQSESYKRRQAEAERQKEEWAREQEEAVKRWREQMAEDRKLIEKYFKSDLFKKFDREVNKVLKSFDPGAFQQFFDDDHMDKMLKEARPSKGLSEGDYRWIETPKERILILKMSMPENAPLDIKIENNHIVVKGEIIEKKEEVTSQGTNFYEASRIVSKTFAVPNDVDADRAQFEAKAGEISIKLPKKNVSDLYKRDKKMNSKPSQKLRDKAPSDHRPDLRPIPKSDGDLTI